MKYGIGELRRMMRRAIFCLVLLSSAMPYAQRMPLSSVAARVAYGVDVWAIQIAPDIPLEKATGTEESEESAWTPLSPRELLLNAHRLRVDGKHILSMGLDALDWRDEVSPVALDLGRGAMMVEPGYAVHLYLERKPKGFTHAARIQIEAPGDDGFIPVHFAFAPLDKPLIFQSELPLNTGVPHQFEGDVTAVPGAWFCLPERAETGETILLFARVVAQAIKPCGQ